MEPIVSEVAFRSASSKEQVIIDELGTVCPMAVDAGLGAIKEHDCRAWWFGSQRRAGSLDETCPFEKIFQFVSIHFDDLDRPSIPAFARQSTLIGRHAIVIACQGGGLDAPTAFCVFTLELDRIVLRTSLDTERSERAQR
jgi:hypothetical protein